MSSVIYLLIAILSSASMAIVLKLFREQRGNRYGILLGNYLTCVVLSFVMLPDKSKALQMDGTTVVCGIIGGFLFVGGLVGMQTSTRKNGAILTSAFAKLGLIVPLLISVIFFGESIRWMQIPGILMVLIAFWLISSDSGSAGLSGSGKEKLPATVYPAILLIVLIACGGGDAMAKIFEQTGQRSQDGHYFLVLFATAVVLVIFLTVPEQRKTGQKILWKEFAAGILVGIPNYFSSFLLLQALNGLPAFVVYPCFSAGTLLIVTLIAAVFFRERPGRKTWTGLGMIGTALILLNL